MKLSQALLGAILVGVTVQASSCSKDKDCKPTKKPTSGLGKPVDCCPACGRG